MKRTWTSALRGKRQRGAATLIVVMVLFFIVSLVAAYASRNLIFEQRTSTNQYRSTLAFEAAEAGLEWALTRLNLGRIDASCAPSTSSADNSFRQRYLNIDPATGHITGRTMSSGAMLTSQCVHDPALAGWRCSCPVDGPPTNAAPTTDAVAPAFQVRLRALPSPPTRPGVIYVESVGCTRLDANCLEFTGQGQAGEGRVVVSAMLALTGSVAAPPVAALMARGDVSAGGTVYNTEPSGSGITVQSGGAITGAISARTIAGTPPNSSLVSNDPALSPSGGLAPAAPYSTSERMFASVFNMFPETFRLQQAAVQRTCPSTGCVAADVRADIAANPGRPIWLSGSLNIDTSGDIGSASEPVILVVNGDLSFVAAGVTVHGLAFLRPQSPASGWVTGPGMGEVRGAVVVDGDVSGTGLPTIVRSSEVLGRLRAGTGTFVRVPASWRDFQ